MKLSIVTMSALWRIGSAADYTATEYDDNIKGGSGMDYMSGGYGNDVMDGGPDVDLLYGSYGDDMLLGGKGKDQLFMGAAKDKVYASLTGGLPEDEDEIWLEMTSTAFEQTAVWKMPDCEFVAIQGVQSALCSIKLEGEKTELAGDLYCETGRRRINIEVPLTNTDEHRLEGLGGNDVMDGRAGTDNMLGDHDDDTMKGGEGDDYLMDYYGSNKWWGGEGGDIIAVTKGQDDTLYWTEDFAECMEVDLDSCELVTRLKDGKTEQMLKCNASRRSASGGIDNWTEGALLPWQGSEVCSLPTEPPTEPPTDACDCDALEKRIEELQAQIACVEPKTWNDGTKTCVTAAVQAGCVYYDHGARDNDKLTNDQIVKVNGKKKTIKDSVEECHNFCKANAAPDADAFTYKKSKWCICKSAGEGFNFFQQDGRTSGYLVETFSSTSCESED